MTSHCRPLLLATAGVAFLLPACLNFQVQPSLPPSVETGEKFASDAPRRGKDGTRDRFAELRSRPGEVVAMRGKGKDTKAEKDTNTSLRPVEMPIAPPPPDSNVQVAGDPSAPHSLPPMQSQLLPEPPLLGIVRAHLEGRTEKALELIKKLEPTNQELVLALLPVLVRAATADLAADPTATALLADQLRVAAERLAPRAALIVENVSLCRKFSGFASYEPWPEGQPYRPNDQAFLYLEVRNLVSQPAMGPRGETHLTYARATVEVRDSYGHLVDQPDRDNWQRRVPVVRFEDKKYTRGPIQDYYILYGFAVPMTPGVYTVTVELRDPAGRRSVKTTPIRFDVAGP